ncbi:MAG: 1-deoxy-D-xylulose-5-phosphate synthase [Actinomycetota bacterium]|nr:1-deoxy-D-xylulose-5-phosphate synthase [Actinomycetota bacterium]
MTTVRHTHVQQGAAATASAWEARALGDGDAQPAPTRDGANGNGHGRANSDRNQRAERGERAELPPVLQDLTPARLRGMDRHALEELAAEIRRFLVSSVSVTGGHLGSNLGAVELTIALHRVFDSPKDPIVWDTGHQAYVHKLVTGRAEGFRTLRQAGGLSGYPNRAESVHDVVENSHASTALGYADGLARARDARGGRNHVVAVVGDGALTGGLAYEGLNNIGFAGRKVIVVLNDNGRSYASTISPLTTACRVGHDPAAAESPEPSAPRSFFGALGFSYIGPVDGHDVHALEAALVDATAQKGPVVVHVHTVKGRNYAPAEADGEKCLHDVSPFDVETGLPRVPKGSVATYTDAFGAALVREAASRPEVVALSAAMTGPTGLLPFAERYGERLVDVGIAEQHAVACAAGMAMGGLRPVVAVYSTFLNRAWDQIVHDVGLHRLPVVFCLDRAGVTGDDGPSHHGVLDLALLTKVPGMVVLAPSSYEEVAVMLRDALDHTGGPVAIRWPKTPARRSAETGAGFRARKVADGDGSVCFLGVGKLLWACELAARSLADEGVAASVWDVRVASPLDAEMLADAASHAVVVTAEDGIAQGGVGSAVAAALRTGALDGGRSPGAVVTCGLPVAYLPHGKPDDILAAHGLDGVGIAAAARRALSSLSTTAS